MNHRSIRHLPVAERLEHMTARCTVTGCWWWYGTVAPDGYGTIGVNYGLRRAHRVWYELVRGPIPQGMVLDHLCRNRSCVNPDHLEPVTTRENIVRGTGPSAENAKRDKCIKGHNDWRIRTNGSRACRECDRMRSRDFEKNRRKRPRKNYAAAR